MKWLLIIVLVLAVVFISGCTVYDDEKSFNTAINEMRSKCESGGGTFTTKLCCKSITSLPNTCNIGACGCSPDNSESVYFCDCEDGKCWDGAQCVAS